MPPKQVDDGQIVIRGDRYRSYVQTKRVLRAFLNMGCVCELFSLTLIGESMSVGYIDTSAALQGRRSRRSGSHGCTLLSYSKQSLQQNQSLKPLELLRCLSSDVLPVLSLNGPRSISTRSPILLKTNRRFSRPEKDSPALSRKRNCPSLR